MFGFNPQTVLCFCLPGNDLPEEIQEISVILKECKEKEAGALRPLLTSSIGLS
jgi:hypothetical protein